MLASDRSLAAVFRVETLVSTAIQREWTVNLGRRVALERVAHLLCEIFERLRPVGLLEGKGCAFPITQMDLADATGLSVVHVNRTIHLEALKKLALFSPGYLHLRAE